MIELKPLSENAVVAHFGDDISEIALRHITLFDKSLQRQPFSGFIETVPSYVSLTIYFDPIEVLSMQKTDRLHAYEHVIHYLKNLPVHPDNNQTDAKEPVQIPVCYRPPYAPDLSEVAKCNQLLTEEVVSVHTVAIYTVYMIGFMPGFPYLGGMSPTIATPRKQRPRAVVPKGSVGIAGAQTGIYPTDSPGGWQIIGRTPITLFDAFRTPYSLLKPGDKLQFYAIDEDEFERLYNANNACV